MALTDYSIDTSGTPQDVQRKQALADALMKQGSDSSPAAGGKNGGWVTALNRGLAGALGGYQRGQAQQEEQQGQNSVKQLMANQLMGADGKINPQASLALASNPWATPQQMSAVSQTQNYQRGLDQDAEHKREFGVTSGFQAHADQRAAAAEGRAASDFENTPDQYVPNPKAGQPGEPQYIDQYAAAAAASANSKPIPFETLGGTKFLMRQPDGSYSKVDPSSIGSPASQPQPAPQPGTIPQAGIQSTPAASGPANAPMPVGEPAPQPTPAQPADLSAVDPKTGRREAWLKSQPPEIQDYIKKVADYEIDPRTSSTKGGHREQIMSAVAQYDPTYDQNTFGVRAKAMKDFGTGAQGNSIRSFDVGISHLDTLQKYAKALGSGDVRLINKIRNAWLEETGSPLPTNVQAIAPIVGAEVSKAIIGSNNALADREELRKPLQIANSPEQIDQAAGAYKELMGGQLKGLKKQYEDTTGKKDFDHRLREDTRNVLLGGGPKAPPGVGDVVKGHKFIGGDPANPASWQKVDSL